MVVAVAATAFVKLVFFREAGRTRLLLPVVRPLLKGVINPRTLRAAARGDTRWAVVHHVGRRSGATYHTPVEAHRTPEGAFILLPYGPTTDWCRNVLAAGGCTLTLAGEELPLTAPEVVPTSVAAAQVPAPIAARWHRQGMLHHLSLKNAPRIEVEVEQATAVAAGP
jgi:deazaflavin-dependent oxidoreductase (nitroreductase family)